jgi:hypothetical protein
VTAPCEVGSGDDGGVTDVRHDLVDLTAAARQADRGGSAPRGDGGYADHLLGLGAIEPVPAPPGN